jgi:hypothetical protein
MKHSSVGGIILNEAFEDGFSPLLSNLKIPFFIKLAKVCILGQKRIGE